MSNIIFITTPFIGVFSLPSNVEGRVGRPIPKVFLLSYCVNTNVGRTVFFIHSLNIKLYYRGKRVFNLHASVGIGVYKSGQGDFNSVTCEYQSGIQTVLKIFQNIYKKVPSPRCASAVTSLC